MVFESNKRTRRMHVRARMRALRVPSRLENPRSVSSISQDAMYVSKRGVLVLLAARSVLLQLDI